MGFWLTTGLGVGGSIVGGLVSRLFNQARDGAILHPAGVVMSLVGAIGLLVVWKTDALSAEPNASSDMVS